MIVNGFIYGWVENGAGFDQNGDPVPSTSQWSDPIPANVQSNSKSTDGSYVGGTFTIARYTIIIDGLEFPYSHVKLIKSGKDLGEFDVQNAEILKFVERVKITV